MAALFKYADLYSLMWYSGATNIRRLVIISTSVAAYSSQLPLITITVCSDWTVTYVCPQLGNNVIAMQHCNKYFVLYSITNSLLKAATKCPGGFLQILLQSVITFSRRNVTFMCTHYHAKWDSKMNITHSSYLKDLYHVNNA